MRSDMSKIIVERPRIGGKLTSFPPRHRPDCARLPMEDYGIMRSVAEISDDERQKFYGRQVFASSKRQLNKKEIRRLRPAPKP